MSVLVKKAGSQLVVVVVTSLVTITLMGAGPVEAFNVPNNSVNSAKIVNNTVNGVDVRNNSLTGQDIRESTLGQVPDAARVNGRRVMAIDFRVDHRVIDAPILRLNGLTLRLTCTNAPTGSAENITVTTSTAVPGNIVSISHQDGSAGDLANSSSYFAAGSVFAAAPVTLSEADSRARQYTITYGAGDSRNVVAQFSTNRQVGGTGIDRCNATGYAIG